MPAGNDPTDIAPVKAGVEAKEAQNPQMILGDALQGVANEADVAPLKIVEAAEIIE